MKYAKKTPDELQMLRRTLINRLAHEQPDIAQAARWIREALGLNQQDFAQLVGLSKPQVARLERGEANPTLETLLAVGKPFGLQIRFCHPEQAPLQQPMPPSAHSVEMPSPQTVAAKIPAPSLPRLTFTKKGVNTHR